MENKKKAKVDYAANPYDNTTPSPVFTGDTGYFKKLDFSDF